jgi:hypothetical protein
LSLVPLFQAAFLIVAFIGSIIIGEKVKFFTPSILPASIIAATLGATFLYFTFLPEQGEFKLPLSIITILCFQSLANMIYKRWHKGQFTYLKTFVLSYLTYIFMIIITIPLLMYHKYPLSYERPFPDELPIQNIIIPLFVGIPFSIVLALFYTNIYKERKSKSTI